MEKRNAVISLSLALYKFCKSGAQKRLHLLKTAVKTQVCIEWHSEESRKAPVSHCTAGKVYEASMDAQHSCMSLFALECVRVNASVSVANVTAWLSAARLQLACSFKLSGACRDRFA